MEDPRIVERAQLCDEVNTISDSNLQSFVKDAMRQIPDKFWEIAASSTGKHHPEQSNGEGGLVRHVLAGLYFVRELCITYDAIEGERDCCIAAMILHDVGKAIAEPHDIVWANSLRYLAKNVYDNELVHTTIGAVRWHMGPWSTGSTMCQFAERGHKRFPQDFNLVEQVVHLADYAASRKRVNLTKLGGLA